MIGAPGGHLEDAMAIAVDGAWQAMDSDDVAQQFEVAGRVLVLAEGGSDDLARGVVDRPQ
jgi:hypothetical protein